jgi:regulator of PEP synthase PpsR (kinase-PPPase family)
MAMKETRAGDYTDEDAVRREVTEAQRLFEREGWPTIDVSRRSIEETAAGVLNLLAEHRGV